MRSMKEIVDAQYFLERYANTPISSIDKEKAQAILYKAGFLTKNGEVAPEYKDVFKSINNNNEE